MIHLGKGQFCKCIEMYQKGQLVQIMSAHAFKNIKKQKKDSIQALMLFSYHLRLLSFMLFKTGSVIMAVCGGLSVYQMCNT